MHPRVIWAIVCKDLLDIWRNKSTLAGLIYPVMMALVFFLISHVVGSSQSTMLIYNPGHSALAQIADSAVSDMQVIQASSAAEVETAFGPDGSQKKSDYAVGLVIPDNFEAEVRAGNRPTIQLFINGSSINGQTASLLKNGILNYARALANPQPPATISTVTINPPSTTNAGAILGQIYTPIVLLMSLTVGASFIPLMLLEEKEKKTLRMLLVTPASFQDILIGKLLVVLFFQLVVTCLVLAILNDFTGNVALVIFYVAIGACFSLSLGLFFGSVFNSTSAAGAMSGFVMTVLILGGIFVGMLGQLLGNSLPAKIAHFLPSYYLADGVLNASQRLGTLGSNLLDTGVVLGSSVILLTVAAWALRRQSAVLAMI